MENKSLQMNWVIRGLLWGSFMFLTLTILIPLAEGDTLVALRVIVKLVIWLVMGIAYGYAVHYTQKQKEN